MKKIKHGSTKMSRERAEKLAAHLTATDDDKWIYRAISPYRNAPLTAVVEVYDENENFLGYL